MPTSSAVTANVDTATAAQYNNLRTDVLSTHTHDGTDGATVAASALPTTVSGAHTFSGTITLSAGTFATQAQMEAETADLPVPAARVRNSPGVAKAWCVVDSTGTLSSPSYNIASVTDTGVGDASIVFDVDFSGTVYITLGSISQGTAGLGVDFSGHAAGSVRRRIATDAGVLTDATCSHTFFGDQ